MNRPALTTAVALAVVLAGALAPTPASADSRGHESPEGSRVVTADATRPAATRSPENMPSWLTTEQRAALTKVSAPINAVDRSSTGLGAKATTTAKKSCKTKSMAGKLYRGSVLAWTEDSFQYYYSPCKQKVTSSSLSQRAGYIFPNVAKAKGTTKYYSSKRKHKWHGRYSIGAGVVTPWGDLTVYSVDVTTNWIAGLIILPDGTATGHLIGEWE